MNNALKFFLSFITPIQFNFLGGLVSTIAGGAVSNLFGKKSAGRANQHSAQQARENRAWQERMSNTAHQREVKDLRKAGLNPILSAGGSGASTPSGGQGQAYQAKTADMGDLGYSARNQVKLQRAQIGTQQASARKINEEAKTASYTNQLTKMKLDYLKENPAARGHGIESDAGGQIWGGATRAYNEVKKAVVDPFMQEASSAKVLKMLQPILAPGKAEINRSYKRVPNKNPKNKDKVFIKR